MPGSPLAYLLIRKIGLIITAVFEYSNALLFFQKALCL